MRSKKEIEEEKEEDGGGGGGGAGGAVERRRRSEEERADLRSLRVVLLGMARYGFPVEHLERLVAVEEEQQL